MKNNEKDAFCKNDFIIGHCGKGRGFTLTKDERLELEEYYRSNGFIVIDPEEDYHLNYLKI